MNTKSFRAVAAMILSVALLMGNIPAFAAAASSEEVLPEPTASVDYYGRAALAELENSEALLYAYDQIVAGVDEGQSQISVYDSANTLGAEELGVVWSAYTRDHTEHFWIAGGYRYSHYSTGEIVSLLPNYSMSGETLTDAKTAFLQAADAMLDGVANNMSEYEKELYLHDKLAEHVTYIDGTNAHNAYGALVEGKAVCDGYAEALQYLLQRAGIQSFIAIGASVNPSTGTSEGHAWNLVRIEGAYYHTDLTWDDQGEDLFHAYFNQTDAVIKEDHVITETAYALPVCDAVDAQYFTGKEEQLTSYTAETVGSLLINNDLRVHVYIPGSLDEFLGWYTTNISDIAAEAGISEICSYGRTRLGHELILIITGMTAAVTIDGDTAAYSTLTKALQNCTDGADLRLLADTAESVTISKEINLNLNGFDITGNVTASANTAVHDSQTDDYTVENGNGYGKLTGVVTGIAPAEGYVSITENDGMSFHKVDVTLVAVNLRAKDAGLYYTGDYAYDEVVKRNLAACGVTLSTENPLPTADDSDSTSRYTVTPRSTLLKDIMCADAEASENRQNGRKPVYCRAYLRLTDGACVYSEANCTNLQTVVETVDAKVWSNLTDTQRSSLVTMYETYSAAMANWDIPNLKAYAAEN